MTFFIDGGAGQLAMPTPVITPTRRGAIQHADSGKGEVLLALHGGVGGFDQSWLLAQALFADLSAWRVLAPSRPGYLDTPLATGRIPEEQADAYAALLDMLEIDKTIVAAVSAAGPSALQFAIRHPNRCEAVILVSAATGALSVPVRVLRRLRMVTWLVRIPGMQAWLRRKALGDPRRTATRSIGDPAVLERTLADPQAGSLFLALQESVMTRAAARLPGTRNDTALLQVLPDLPLAEVRVPVLVIHGTADAVVPFSHAERVVRQAPKARLCGIEGGEHVVLFTHLAEVRAAASAFLAGVLDADHQSSTVP
ncbi:alpha/beta fold hydrolase [Rhizobium terrae]|uniref:alpha/beta fold hydrolase n=1 Tax=Rhizobium terrae TaxID=2171756 RepID=UPI000E3D3820|nr:alpha/beta hydrolase [Rhizobium terrae]